MVGAARARLAALTAATGYGLLCALLGAVVATAAGTGARTSSLFAGLCTETICVLLGTAAGALSAPPLVPAAGWGVLLAGLIVAVLRALLYQSLGDLDSANNALADLKRWENLRQLVPGPIGLGHVTSRSTPFRESAQLESIGPLFVRGEYSQIIDIYEPLAQRIHAVRQSERAEDALFWTLFLPFKAIDAIADRLLAMVARESEWAGPFAG